MGQGILLYVDQNFQLKAFVDSDWGACIDTRRSVTGFCVFLGQSLISSKSKKHATVSCSSAEVEYRALASVFSEIVWLTQLLGELQVPSQQPSIVYCDNHVAITIANNLTFHERTKHIEIDCHFTRDLIQQGTLRLFLVRSVHQLADDMFTKALPASSLQTFMCKMEIFNIHRPS